MRLKYLTLCVLGLSLSACSQHVIKTNVGSASLEQKAINSLNAMYEYPSYDYKGKFNVHVDLAQNKTPNPTDKPALDAALKQKVEQYWREQKVSLNSKQKQALYATLTQTPTVAGKSKADQFANIMTNVLNDMQFEYDGSVHYRQKMGSFNLTARYEKPTLLVQAKVPMVLDLNDYKFYINYFALMPYLVNKENQNNLAYLDFSKYQDAFKQVDYKKFVEYVKASSAVYYRLADQTELEAISLTSADKAAGVVEKIRLKSSIEELLLQANLYSKVNEKYLVQSVLRMKGNSLEQEVAEKVDAAVKDGPVASAKDSSADAVDNASVVSQELYKLVNQHFGVEDQVDDYEGIEEAEEVSADAAEYAEDAAENAVEAVVATEAATYAAAEAESYAAEVAEAAEATEVSVEAAVDATEMTEEAAVAGEEEVGLTDEQCTALSNSQKINYGDVQYCQTVYDINVFDSVAKASPETYSERSAAVEKIFAAYNNNQFVDDHAFKALWLRHQAEIEKTLPPMGQRNPFVMDVGLDAQGRAIKLDYDLNYAMPKLKSSFQVKADMQVLNYGKATPIDQVQLKRAKTWAEASKGSMLENIVGGFSKKLGTDIQERSAEPYTLSLDDQLKMIAEQRYDATQSYAKTYQTVFIAKLAEMTPQLLQHYSARELQEIANVYAYWYSDEETYNPEGQALKNIKALQKKHHLTEEDQFDNDLGQAVHRIVTAAMRGEQDRQAWRKLKAKYKQPQQLFAKQYQNQFERENSSSDEPALLEQTAAILGKVYVDAQKKQLTEKSIKTLKIEHNEFIDYEIFKDVYQKMLTVK